MAADADKSNTHRIDVEPAGGGKSHCFFGNELMATGRGGIEFTVCRILADRWVAGTIETWHRGASYPSMRIDIAAGAKLAVSETEKSGPRIVSFKPFPVEGRLPLNPSRVQPDLSAGGIHPSGQ